MFPNGTVWQMDMVDPRLHTLRVLRSEGTVTATAAALHLTPSTVSQQLQHLAADLRLTLLEPQGRRVRLTAAAHALLRHADDLAARWARAEGDFDAYRSGSAGHLRISSIATGLASIVLPAVDRLAAAYPGMTFELREDAHQDRSRLLLAGRIDIAVLIPAPQEPGAGSDVVESRVLAEEPLDLIVPASHRCATRSAVALAELAEETWIAAGDPADQQLVLRAACASAGFTPRLAHDALEWRAVAALVAHGHGIALLPRHTPVDGELRRLRIGGSVRPSRTIVAQVRRGTSRQPTIEQGLAALAAAARRLERPRSLERP